MSFEPFDFDAASAAWLLNKRKFGGSYEYICQYIHSNGKKCGKGVSRGGYSFCKKHGISGPRKANMDAFDIFDS